jgi:hypothetical protein
MRIGIAALILAAAGLTGCSTTGNSFDSAGLNRIVEGRTTLAQASEYLRAVPVDTWRRTDGSVLARWAHKGSVVTDAVYFRQEAWLLFGADGTFQRTEKTINMPLMNRTRTQEEADRAAAEIAARAQVGEAPGGEAAVRDSLPGEGRPWDPPSEEAQAIPLEPESALPPSETNALLPAGMTYTPGVSYPISHPK